MRKRKPITKEAKQEVADLLKRYSVSYVLEIIKTGERNAIEATRTKRETADRLLLQLLAAKKNKTVLKHWKGKGHDWKVVSVDKNIKETGVVEDA